MNVRQSNLINYMMIFYKYEYRKEVNVIRDQQLMYAQKLVNEKQQKNVLEDEIAVSNFLTYKKSNLDIN